MVSMQISLTRFHIAPATTRRSTASGLAFACLVVVAGCATGGASSGTYRPENSISDATGASWYGEPSGVHINVSVNERRLYLKNGSNVIQSYTVGVGRDGNETPQGDYTVRRIVWNPTWN